MLVGRCPWWSTAADCREPDLENRLETAVGDAATFDNRAAKSLTLRWLTIPCCVISPWPPVLVEGWVRRKSSAISLELFRKLSCGRMCPSNRLLLLVVAVAVAVVGLFALFGSGFGKIREEARGRWLPTDAAAAATAGELLLLTRVFCLLILRQRDRFPFWKKS